MWMLCLKAQNVKTQNVKAQNVKAQNVKVQNVKHTYNFYSMLTTLLFYKNVIARKKAVNLF
jgi:hypothetical protein